jgi:hypothetical protein
MQAAEDPSQVGRAVNDLWRFYEEHAAQARQHEDLRASVTSTLGGFAAALVGFAGIGGLHPSDVPAGLLVMVFGLLGAVLSLKHYERNRLHVRVMGAVRDEISMIQAAPEHTPRSTQEVRTGAEADHGEHFTLRRKQSPEDEPASWLVRASLARLWAALPLAVAAAGAAIVVVAVV